ncbi:homeobox protein vent1-like [Zootoca vivipara]|uniref:homeobox protein vent1-like n=1 Tax=Zootoca vivipara TaxID=8524 RepID=UPI001591A7ED|nr:homeobox protein vent1-like [Zootoca vivipara]
MGQRVCDQQGIARKPHICCVPAPSAPNLCKGSSRLGKAQPKKPCPSAGLRREDAAAASGGEGWSKAPETAADDSLIKTGKGPCASEPVSARETSKSAASDVNLDPEERQRHSRLRTAFTIEQIRGLESTFRRQTYLKHWERQGLAAELQLTDEQVKNWFQNRRMKLKRHLQDYRRGIRPSSSSCLLCQPRIPGSLPDEFAMYSSQSILPYMPNPALWPNPPGCKYLPFQNPPYPFPLPGLPYHFPTQFLGNSTEEYKMDSKKTFPTPALGYGMV